MFDEQIRLEESTSMALDYSDEGSGSSTVSTLLTGSSGYDEFDLIGAATTAKPLVDSVRKDSQAWFFGWLRDYWEHQYYTLLETCNFELGITGNLVNICLHIFVRPQLIQNF
jgi:hypothetical protein